LRAETHKLHNRYKAASVNIGFRVANLRERHKAATAFSITPTRNGKEILGAVD
jgi:hypothetical protein